MTYDPMRDIASSVIAAAQKGTIMRMGRVITTFVEDSATYANLEMVGHKVVPHVLCCTDVLLEAEDTAWVADLGMGRWLIIGRVAAGRTPPIEPPPPPPPPPPTDTTPPSVPTTVVAIAGNATVSLTWTPSPQGDTAGYNIYRDGVKKNPILVTTNTYLDGAVTNGTTYSYRVSAVDNNGNESAQSTPAVNATPTAAEPPPTPPPVDLSARRAMFDLYLPSGALILNTYYPKHGQNGSPQAQRVFAASVFAPYVKGKFRRFDLDLYLVPTNTTALITLTLKNITTAVDVQSISVANNTAPDADGHVRVTATSTAEFLDGQLFSWFVGAAPVPCAYSGNVKVHYDLVTS